MTYMDEIQIAISRFPLDMTLGMYVVDEESASVALSSRSLLRSLFLVGWIFPHARI